MSFGLITLIHVFFEVCFSANASLFAPKDIFLFFVLFYVRSCLISPQFVYWLVYSVLHAKEFDVLQHALMEDRMK